MTYELEKPRFPSEGELVKLESWSDESQSLRSAAGISGKTYSKSKDKSVPPFEPGMLSPGSDKEPRLGAVRIELPSMARCRDLGLVDLVATATATTSEGLDLAFLAPFQVF